MESFFGFTFFFRHNVIWCRCQIAYAPFLYTDNRLRFSMLYNLYTVSCALVTKVDPWSHKDCQIPRLETSPFCASEEYRDSRISGFTGIQRARERSKKIRKSTSRDWPLVYQIPCYAYYL